MRFIKVLLLLVLFIGGLLFFVQNSAELGFVQQAGEGGKTLTLQFDLYFHNLQWKSPAVPLYVVILTSFGVGMLFATLLLFIDRIRLGCSLMGARRANRSLEKEVERLRVQTAPKKTELPADAAAQ
ncbi:MAG: LapA family protein [Desulfovibrio sp.]|jgi:uncharacterized integral membrane protein|nr:LapA family protein [Desulfovibrio sp.]